MSIQIVPWGLFFIKLCGTFPDETARAVIQVPGRVSTLRTFDGGRFRVAHPIAYAIMKKYPTAVQIVMGV